MGDGNHARAYNRDMKKPGIILSLLASFFLAGCSSGNSSNSSAAESTPVVSSSSLASSSEDKSSSSKDISSGTSSESYVPVSSIQLDKSALDLLTDDYSYSLNATVLPENATNKDVTWQSSNVAAAMVDNGVVTPVGAGTTVITAKTVAR